MKIVRGILVGLLALVAMGASIGVGVLAAWAGGAPS
jgi:hypothetical protein